jgi:hypothetical protein
MNTLKISVKSNKDAVLLTKLLKSLNFVINVEPVLENKVNKKNQYELLNDLIEKKANSKLFKEIIDPVRWQKKLRNEWS